MKILLIGGTGKISTAISQKLQMMGHQLTLLNRGKRSEQVPDGTEIVVGDIHDEDAVAKLLAGRTFDVVANFIAFEVADVQRDFRLFQGKTKQYIFISSASAYQKPPVNPVIMESTPLANPYWEYSRKKIACEDWLMGQFRDTGFPLTIVRPSHTYDEFSIPLALHGNKGAWQTLRRMLEGKPVPIHGDGSTLWTLTHSRDFADAFIGLLGNPHSIGQAIQITSDECLTWTQVHEIIAARLGVTLNPLYVPSGLLSHVGNKFGYDFAGGLLGDKSCNAIFDNTKLKQLVPGFQATTRFDQGMDEAISNMYAHPELQQEDAEYDAFCDDLSEMMEDMFQRFAK